MDMDTFIREKEQIKKKSVEEQKGYYKNLLETEPAGSAIRLQAYFHYARLFYEDGDFHKSREILEPIMINYQSYSYDSIIIPCFNLMGISCHCETEYQLSRYFYNKALEIARSHNDCLYFSYEYNNIAASYIAQGIFEKALRYISLAEESLPESDEEMGAYVYVNKTIIYYNLDRLEEAFQSYQLSQKLYRAEELLPDDYLIWGTSLFYKLGQTDRYEQNREKTLERLDKMCSAEYMDACRVLFDCGLDARDYDLVHRIIGSMEQYLLKYPQELRVGVRVEELKYRLAEKQDDPQNMLKAIEQKNFYKHQIIALSEQQRAFTYEQFLMVNNDLRKAIENKEKANQVKTQFLSNMSHDMRTPINGIIGMLHIIQKNREDQARVDDCLDKIALSADHLLSLINNVLDMTKLETESIHVEKEPFELDQVCHEAMELVTFQAMEAGLHVHEEHDDVRGIHLLGSPLYLKKILLNLFSNSIKYNKPEGHIFTRMRIVKRTASTLTCEFQIQDTGIGMTEEFLKEKLFRPFTQEQNSARSDYEGSGLGMAIVAQLVKRLNGTIDVKSVPGEGSCFTVVLPFEIDQEPEQPKSADLSDADIRGMHFLVAEDNELNMEIVEFLLTEEGATIDKACNGQAALELYEKGAAGTYDVILMDLMMPVMDGYEATRKIRASGKADARTIPIIAMSAKAFTEDIAASLEAGMNVHLSKPLFRNELIGAIVKYKQK